MAKFSLNERVKTIDPDTEEVEVGTVTAIYPPGHFPFDSRPGAYVGYEPHDGQFYDVLFDGDRESGALPVGEADLQAVLRTFSVTTALTAYTTYRVKADSVERAKAIVSDSSQRAALDSWGEAGYGDDEEVIGVKEETS